MIRLAQLLRQYQEPLIQQYATKMQPRHYQAMQAIMDCHTPACGEMSYVCTSCGQLETLCHSCGHRSCPACQHQTNNQWLDRQRQKLLPVEYYMVTFTLPAQLRAFIWHHQAWAFNALFSAAAQTLTTFAKHDSRLGGIPGMTGVLHTHSRRMEFHPHVHFVVPGGVFNPQHSLWKPKPGKYLFNGRAMAKVFRAKFTEAMSRQGFRIPEHAPPQWVVQCQHVGRGEPALTYLARYLYRGVIREENILRHENGEITFQYQDNQTRQWKKRTETAVKFLWLVLQHVLPKGFRRTRDYGFLHGNSGQILQRLQLILRVAFFPSEPETTVSRHCPCCQTVMRLIRFIRPRKTGVGRQAASPAGR